MSYHDEVPLSELVGKTLAAITREDEEITFRATDGSSYKLYHDQDCCESVYVESIVGELSDLIGEPILKAEEVSTDGTPPQDADDEKYGSYTWTFYKFATRKGYVDIRWYGTSNGYYSERVSFVKL